MKFTVTGEAEDKLQFCHHLDLELRDRLEDGTGRFHARFSLPLPHPPPGVPADTDVILGIRPQYWRRAPAGFQAEAEVIESTGAETQLDVSLHGHRLTVVLHEQLDIRRGDPVTLLPDVDRMLFFDPASERRIA